jgi:hypothetical protein
MIHPLHDLLYVVGTALIGVISSLKFKNWLVRFLYIVIVASIGYFIATAADIHTGPRAVLCLIAGLLCGLLSTLIYKKATLHRGGVIVRLLD